MLSTRNVGAKGDEESNFTILKSEVVQDDDSRGYHHTSYRRDGSSDYKRWLMYILTTVIVGYFLWSSLISPKAQPLIVVDSSDASIAIPLLPVEVQIDSLRKISAQDKFLDEHPLIIRPLQIQPDAMGCYHSIPELDVGKHIVPPPPGPVKLVCCQSTKGEISCRIRTDLLSQLRCCHD